MCPLWGDLIGPRSSHIGGKLSSSHVRPRQSCSSSGLSWGSRGRRGPGETRGQEKSLQGLPRRRALGAAAVPGSGALAGACRPPFQRPVLIGTLGIVKVPGSFQPSDTTAFVADLGLSADVRRFLPARLNKQGVQRMRVIISSPQKAQNEHREDPGGCAGPGAALPPALPRASPFVTSQEPTRIFCVKRAPAGVLPAKHSASSRQRLKSTFNTVRSV